jgi:hypothetical protein
MGEVEFERIVSAQGRYGRGLCVEELTAEYTKYAEEEGQAHTVFCEFRVSRSLINHQHQFPLCCCRNRGF